MKFNFQTLVRTGRLLLAASVLAGVSSHAYAAETVGIQSASEAAAACLAMVDQTQSSDGSVKTDAELAEMKSLADVCRNDVRNAYNRIRQLGAEYVVGGIGLVGGFEFNTPVWHRASENLSGMVGLAAFLVNNSETHASGVRFVPLMSGTIGASLVSSAPQLFELQKGIIILYSVGAKSINDFNGTYGGASVEIPTPGFSALNSRSSVSASFFIGGSQTFAAMLIHSTNAGTGTSGGIKAFNIQLATETGAGMSVTDIPKSIGN